MSVADLADELGITVEELGRYIADVLKSPDFNSPYWQWTGRTVLHPVHEIQPAREHFTQL